MKKRYSCPWTGRISTVKIIITKAIFKFDADSIKIPMTFFIEQEKASLKST